MSIEDNKARARSGYHAMSTGTLDALDEIVSPDFVDHNPDPGQGPGLEGLKESFAALRRAFPDLRLEVHDMVGEGDKIAARVVVLGTHEGALQGVAPTGRQVRFDVMDILRFDNGKVVERWGVVDNLALLQQVGAILGEGPA